MPRAIGGTRLAGVTQTGRSTFRSVAVRAVCGAREPWQTVPGRAHPRWALLEQDKEHRALAALSRIGCGRPGRAEKGRQEKGYHSRL